MIGYSDNQGEYEKQFEVEVKSARFKQNNLYIKSGRLKIPVLSHSCESCL